jgi:hypothetical protein
MIGIQGGLQDDTLFEMRTNDNETTFELLVSFCISPERRHLMVLPATRPLESRLGPDPTKDYIDHEDEISSKHFAG